MRQPALACAALLFATSAWAHAFPRPIESSGGATVAAPKEVSIWFTEEVEPAISRIAVTEGSGTGVDEGGSHIDATYRPMLHIALKRLPPGTCKMTWHVVSVDTRHTQGNFTSTVTP